MLALNETTVRVRLGPLRPAGSATPARSQCCFCILPKWRFLQSALPISVSPFPPNLPLYLLAPWSMEKEDLLSWALYSPNSFRVPAPFSGSLAPVRRPVEGSEMSRERSQKYFPEPLSAPVTIYKSWLLWLLSFIFVFIPFLKVRTVQFSSGAQLYKRQWIHTVSINVFTGAYSHRGHQDSEWFCHPPKSSLHCPFVVISVPFPAPGNHRSVLCSSDFSLFQSVVVNGTVQHVSVWIWLLVLNMTFVWCGFSLSLVSSGVHTAFWICKFIYITKFGIFFLRFIFLLYFSWVFFLLYFWNPNDLSIGSFGIIPQLPETPLSYLFSVSQIRSFLVLKLSSQILPLTHSFHSSSNQVIYSDVLSFSLWSFHLREFWWSNNN